MLKTIGILKISDQYFFLSSKKNNIRAVAFRNVGMKHKC